MTEALDQVRERIAKNFPTGKQAQSRRDFLQWDRRDATSVVSTCGNFMISTARGFRKNQTVETWNLFKFVDGKPFKIGGPFSSPTRARQAADDYLHGQPLQLDLA